MSKKGVELFTMHLAEKADELEQLVSINNPALPENEHLVSVNNPASPEIEPLVSVANPPDVDALLTMTQGPDLQNDTELLFQKSVPIRASVLAKPKSRSFTGPTLDPAQMAKYKEIFKDGEDHYDILAKIIRHQNAIAVSSLERKHTNLKNRLSSIIPAVQFAVAGAREEYRQAVANKQPDTEIKSLKQKMEKFEEIQDMFLSLKSLTKNRSRYTEAQLEDRLQKLDSKSDNLDAALAEVVKNNLFDKRKLYQTNSMGSTPFERIKPSLDLGKVKKRVKIEHKNGGKEVSAIFSYNRSKALGHSKAKIWKTRGGEFKELKSQIRDLVNVGVSEYDKGSAANPINIKYIPPNIPQPEAALMLLMEYKKRAILEGKTFHATDKNGNAVDIMPTTNFTDAERAYFMSYALEKPQLEKAGELEVNKGCAGYKIFKQGGVKDMDKSDSPPVVQKAMDDYLALELKKSGLKLNAKLDSVADALKATSDNNTWEQDNSPAQKPAIRN